MPETPTQKAWDEAFHKSHELSPTPSTWGLFVFSDAPPVICGSGFGSFHWFRTKPQMIRFARNYMAWWHPGPSSTEPEDIAARVQAIVDSVDPKTADLARLRNRLNKYMSCLWHIEWWGQFKQLTDGRGKFALKVRRGFFESEELDLATTKRPPPIAKSHLHDFKEYLREYGI